MEDKVREFLEMNVLTLRGGAGETESIKSKLEEDDERFLDSFKSL